jgi:hypothetical protein
MGWLRVSGASVVLLSVGLLAFAPGCASSSDAGGDDVGSGQGSDLSGAKKLPNFETMWKQYPGGEVDEVKKLIGGDIDADWITNTCTIRLSRVFNYSGAPVPAGPKQSAKGLHTIKGADGKNYGYRVAEMRDFMLATYGNPDITVSSPNGGPGVDPQQFAGKKGVVLFEVHVWSDASGHADLFNGSDCGHECYFDKASKVQLWLAPSDAPAPATADPPPSSDQPTDTPAPPADDNNPQVLDPSLAQAPPT